MKEENNNFNVNNPTKENIEYAFKNLIFYVNASSHLEIYKNQKNMFEKALTKVDTILSQYINTESLVQISDELLQEVKYDLIDLDTETKSLKSYYAEWSLMWIDAIISLRVSEIKMEGANNGR